MTKQKSLTLLLAENTRLESKRLILRPLTLEDSADIFAYVSDEETMKYIFKPHTSLNQTKEFIASYYLSSPLGFYALELKENKKMIGVVEFRVDDKTRQGEIGYMLNKSYWNQGLTTEACLQILDFGFNLLLLEKIVSGHDTGHANSGKVLKKIGMSFTYIAKNPLETNGEVLETTFYEITRETFLTDNQNNEDLSQVSSKGLNELV